jgi:cupin fold WbuC family metalloprotein
MRARKVSPEVFYADEPVVRVASADISDLVAEAVPMPRKRSRLCTHRGVDDALHEMLIVHHRDAYVRPHRHIGKAESMHVIQGETDLVLFDDAGGITECIRLGEFSSGHPFYYRMSDPIYHALIIRSEWLVFHEVTSGPLRREESEFAPWGPPDADEAGVAAFLSRVEAGLAALRRAK